MRILLFGTTGQVGWELARSLQPRGNVVVASRPQADFDNPESVRAAIAWSPDVIVNAVAYTAVDKAEGEPDAAMRVNADAVRVIAEEARKCGALFIHFSTDYVFDGEEQVPYTESHVPNPQSVYGRTKRAGEEAIEHVGGDYLILRTSWVFASRGRNFVRTILRLASERETLRIVADQFGAPTSARLIADCTAQIVERATMERSAGNFASGIFHLTASGRTSWHGLASRIVDRARAASPSTLTVKQVEPITTADYPVPAKRPFNSSLDTTRISQRFGLYLPSWTAGVDLCLDELLSV